MSGKNASVGVGRVVVGTSGSPGSLRALRYAEVVARAHDALLVPAIAWVPPEGDRAGPRFASSSDLRKVWQEMAWQRLRDALIAVWGEVPDDPMVEPHVERGAAGWVLVSLACRRGDLLVVGAGRHGALARTVSCRVSRYCVAHAQCPVLTIPPAALAQEIRHGPHAWAFWHRTLTPARVLQDQARPANYQ
jgi:nucleotide-binding universal stress UspA family protein